MRYPSALNASIAGVLTASPIFTSNITSGDGGWMHLGPHVAAVLSAKGFFVVGFDTRAYLESFTSGAATLGVDDEPGDYKALVDYAFDTLGADVVRAYAEATNIASIRVAEKVGLPVAERFDEREGKQVWHVVRMERRRDT